VKFEDWQELAEHVAEAHPEAAEAATVQSPGKTAATTADSPSKEAEVLSVKSEKVETTSAEQQQQPQQKDTEATPNKVLVPSNKTPVFNNLCEICSSKFESYQKLQAHLLIKHEFNNLSGVFTCPVCDEAYSRPENLLAHANIHGGAAKIYKCTQCTQAFVFKSQLINHSFSHHPPNVS